MRISEDRVDVSMHLATVRTISGGREPRSKAGVVTIAGDPSSRLGAYFLAFVDGPT